MRTALALLAAPALLAAGAATSARAARPHNVTVTMINRPHSSEPWAFRPTTIRIARDTTVVWRNRSSEAHTVTATGQHPAFDSGLVRQIQPGHLYSHRFTHAGTYTYFCALHPYMTGKIVVR